MTSPCASTAIAEEDSGFADALLWEAIARLTDFAASGESSSIDLGGLPMSNRDRESLDDFLGRGEVSATIEVAGRTEVWETRFSAVWRVRHFGDGKIATDLIEITSCPRILSADRRDAEVAARRMGEALELKNGIAEAPHET
ncbi:hydrogenase expression/formation protein [Rhodoblastus acidophilus]|uniref:Hydrogenase expression/formation protein n=1 Tax=Candidatus Rhodoblastus alkanivorans TaxID=2954117 RepID=A0ABS9Z9Y2_9HYPH|nr:hydrogenase expression/formation protein [Candidatus Rhodoblastus alkanivorans]MCI4680684.1 hydrogenase expression/formation protein [Candidatus Rhodoblastus alkanivorans]MCI4684371.1 hydrogenase expression/formation protein [Candidatus Rhodoblastus alkanivorans]MDI4641692.1 hydrogenase expression/formation protein [Rhodoblastus acidophilus]